MGKLKMAHDWAMKYGSSESLKLTMDKAWKYADAMQAEAVADEIEMCEESVRCLQWVLGDEKI